MLQIVTASIEWGHATHAGRREANEDALRVTSAPADGIDRGRFFAIADGMGGQQGGGLASQMACDGLDGYYQRPMAGLPPWSAHQFKRHLEETVLRIDLQIRRHGYRDPALADMGTTLSCLIMTARHTIIAHVGDSRIYRLRRGRLTCLTTDHTFVQDMIFEGEVDPAHAAEHPLRHMLTRVVGTVEPLEWVDTRFDPLLCGDRFLLCTDGLHNSLAAEQIALILNNHGHARQIAMDLVSNALQAGARDNITALVIKNDKNKRSGNE